MCSATMFSSFKGTCILLNNLLRISIELANALCLPVSSKSMFMAITIGVSHPFGDKLCLLLWPRHAAALSNAMALLVANHTAGGEVCEGGWCKPIFQTPSLSMRTSSPKVIPWKAVCRPRSIQSFLRNSAHCSVSNKMGNSPLQPKAARSQF